MRLIKFKQTVCAPCSMLDNYLENELGVTVDEEANITNGIWINLKTGEIVEDYAYELAGELDIMKSPTLVLLDNDGNKIDEVIGTSKSLVDSIIKKRGLI